MGHPAETRDDAPKCKKKLKKGTRKSSELQTARKWNRTISGNAIIKYEQYDPELATVVVVSVRPEHLGGAIVVVDGQHTGMMDILGECDQDLPASFAPPHD